VDGRVMEAAPTRAQTVGVSARAPDSLGAVVPPRMGLDNGVGDQR
jgi:hypothetical protein